VAGEPPAAQVAALLADGQGVDGVGVVLREARPRLRGRGRRCMIAKAEPRSSVALYSFTAHAARSASRVPGVVQVGQDLRPRLDVGGVALQVRERHQVVQDRAG
jgi:hypothetical protein